MEYALTIFAVSVRVRAKNGADSEHKKTDKTKRCRMEWIQSTRLSYRPIGFIRSDSDRALMVKNSDHEISRKIHVGIVKHVANFINLSE